VTVPAEVFPELSTAQLDRLAFRRGQARRSRVLAGSSTVLFLAVMGTVIVLSPGWPRVKAEFFNWDVAKHSLPPILEGFWLNIRILAVCAVLIVLVGLSVAGLLFIALAVPTVRLADWANARATRRQQASGIA
jgi:hypothetical protein